MFIMLGARIIDFLFIMYSIILLSVKSEQCRDYNNIKNIIFSIGSNENHFRVYSWGNKSIFSSIKVSHSQWQNIKYVEPNIPTTFDLLPLQKTTNLFWTISRIADDLQRSKQFQYYYDITNQESVLHLIGIEWDLRKHPHYTIYIKEGKIFKCDKNNTSCKPLTCKNQAKTVDLTEKISNNTIFLGWKEENNIVEIRFEIQDYLKYCIDTDNIIHVDNLLIPISEKKTIKGGSFSYIQTKIDSEFILESKKALSLDVGQYVRLLVLMCQSCNLTASLQLGNQKLASSKIQASSYTDIYKKESEWQEILLKSPINCPNCQINITTANNIPSIDPYWIITSNVDVVNISTENFVINHNVNNFELLEKNWNHFELFKERFGVEVDNNTVICNFESSRSCIRFHNRNGLEITVNTDKMPVGIIEWCEKRSEHIPYKYLITVTTVPDNKIKKQTTRITNFMSYIKNRCFIEPIFDLASGTIYEVRIISETSFGVEFFST